MPTCSGLSTSALAELHFRFRCYRNPLFGANGWRWRVVRTSNAYAFRDPKASESEQRTGTLNQEIPPSHQAPAAAAKRLQQRVHSAVEDPERRGVLSGRS